VVKFRKNLKCCARDYENVVLVVRPLHPAIYGSILIFQIKCIMLTVGVEILVTHQAGV